MLSLPSPLHNPSGRGGILRCKRNLPCFGQLTALGLSHATTGNLDAPQYPNLFMSASG
jgi:hypothetical protein